MQYFVSPPQDLLDPLMRVCEELCSSLEEVCPGEVVLENRTHLSLSARRRHTEVAGYPVTIMVGKKVRTNKSMCFCDKQ